MTWVLGVALAAGLAGPGRVAAFERDPRVEAPEVLRTDPAVPRSQAGQWKLTRDDARWDLFRTEHGQDWRVRWNEATGFAHRVYGGRIPAARLVALAPADAQDKAAVLRLAEAAVRSHAELLGARWEELRPVYSAFRGGRWVVTLQQVARGLEVVGGRVDLRFSPAGDLVLFGADIYPVPSGLGPRRLGAARVVEAARAGLPSQPDGTEAAPAGEPELVLLPMLADEPRRGNSQAAPRRPIAPEDVRVREAFRLRLRTEEPPGDWETYVDAVTGEVLWRYNRVRFAAVGGTVNADIHPLTGADTPVAAPLFDAQLLGGINTSTVVSYGFEGGAAGWTAQAPWALAGESVHGGTGAWSDSPGGAYANNLEISLTSPTIDISTVMDPVLDFWVRTATEELWDFLYVEASADNGTTWKKLRTLSGTTAWHLESVDLADVEGASALRVRFRFLTDDNTTADGCWIDDVTIARRGSGATDAGGSYALDTSGGDNTVTTRMRGLHADITNLGGAEASQSVVAAGGVANFSWTNANSTAGERDMLHAVEIAHRRLKEIDPAFTALDYPLPVYVNLGNYCNAFWGGQQIVVGSGTPPSCLDLGTWRPVMYHEYAHGITDYLYEPVADPPGDMHEAFSDYFAATIGDDPRVGPGILGPGSMFRTIDNKWRDPEDRAGQVHMDGTILAGALWDMRKLLLPDVNLSDSLFHFARYGFPMSYEDYFLELLTVDDDNANLGDGTPHLEAIRSAFGYHGIGLGPEFKHVAVTVQDAGAGNGDGRLDPGETAELLVSFRNYGGAETGVYAKLSTATPGVTVTSDSVFVGNVGAGAEPTKPSTFAVQVDGSVPAGTAIVFDLDLHSDVGFNGDCFMLPTGYVPILLVDDDRARVYEDYYTGSLDRLGKGYTRWVAATLGSPTAEEMAEYRAVIWFTGVDGTTTFAPGDRDEVSAYLAAGGRMFVTGVNIAEDMYVAGSAAEQSFYQNALHATVNLASEGSSPPSVNGVGGDVVGNGLAFTLTGGTGAGNQAGVSSMFPQGGAVPSLTYSNGRTAAVRFEGAYRMFHCGFGFEGVSTEAQRDSLMSRVLRWLCPAEASVPSVTVADPNGGELLIGNSVHTIQWSASDDVAVLSVNILLSLDGGSNYSPVATGVPNSFSYSWTVPVVSSSTCRIRVEAVDPSNNVGADASDQDFRITDVTEVADSPLPGRYALHAPVPNPFTATTRLRFDLPRASRVWLEILSVDGRRVRAVLAGEPLEAGRIDRAWNGRDEGGRPVASGVYLARLRADGFIATRKLLLVK